MTHEVNIKQILLDENKLNEFILENKNLIIRVIKDVCPSIFNTYEKEDYIQEGFISLYKAIKKYDESKGIKFGTFAYIVIKRDLLKKIKCEQNKIYQCKKDIISLNKTMNYDEENKTEILDTLQSQDNTEEQCVESNYVNFLLSKLDKELFNKLNPKYKIILFKLMNDKKQADIARELKCSRENIRQKVKRIRNMVKKLDIA